VATIARAEGRKRTSESLHGGRRREITRSERIPANWAPVGEAQVKLVVICPDKQFSRRNPRRTHRHASKRTTAPATLIRWKRHLGAVTGGQRATWDSSPLASRHRSRAIHPRKHRGSADGLPS